MIINYLFLYFKLISKFHFFQNFLFYNIKKNYNFYKLLLFIIYLIPINLIDKFKFDQGNYYILNNIKYEMKDLFIYMKS